MLSSSSLALPRRTALPVAQPPLPLVALLALCLLLALAPSLPWRAAPAPPGLHPAAPDMAAPSVRWAEPQILLPANGRAGTGPLSPALLPDGLFPVMLATLERTAAPAYRLRPLPAMHGQPAGYAAANPTTHLNLRFAAGGLALRQQGQPGTLRLALTDLGYGRRLAPVGAARPQRSGNAVRYQHGGLVEWYRNGPLGLEQGFTLVAPPVLRGAGPLTLRLLLAGDLAPRLLGDTLLLGGHGLRYSGLYAADATGRRLAARLVLAPARGGWAVTLLVDDRGARYPLTIDPTFTLQSTLLDPSTDSGGFGGTVALSGDGLTALVGASGNVDGGAAFVFSRSSAGVPFPTTPTTTLLDPGSGPDNFGSAVALSGDGLTALVGADGTTKGSASFAGAVYVYSRASTSAAFPASPTTALADPGPGANQFGVGDLFGSAVALSGDGLTALVGADGTTKGSNADAGAAYVYSRTSAGAAFPTSPTTALIDPGSGGDEFGSAVALSGDGLTTLIGAAGTTRGSTFGAGAAYVYSRANGSAAFPTSPTTTLPDPVVTGFISDSFGEAMALSGDGLTALIGAGGTTKGSAFGAGAAYVYSRASASAAFPTSPTTSFADPGPGRDAFGFAVALSGDGLTALVGAVDTTRGSNADAGAAYAYSRTSATIAFSTTPTTSFADPGSNSTGLGDLFGFSLALSGDGLTALIGAPGNAAGGAAHVYSRAGTSATFPASPTTTLANPHSGPGGDAFGASVALSSDGLTALVGATRIPPNSGGGFGTPAGVAYVYSRSSTGVPFPTTPATTLLHPGLNGDAFGSRVALSADGLTALVAAPDTSRGSTPDAGVAYVYSRSSAGAPFPANPTSTLADPGSGVDFFGDAVALSGDGLTALVGAGGTTEGNTDFAGAAYVYSRSSAGVPFPTSPTTILPDPGPASGGFGGGFGRAVALSGNGLTALIGAPNTARGSTTFAGVAYVYARASMSAAFSTSPTTTLADPGSGGDAFGSAIALSADGLTTLIGAPNTTKGSTSDAGAAYVYSRSSAGAPFPATPSTTLPDPGSGADSFGSVLTLSGDGLTALFGVVNFTNGAGAAYVYRRSSIGAAFPANPTQSLSAPAGAEFFGDAVALSADGQIALVGAEGTAEQRIGDAGAAYVFGPAESVPIAINAGWNLISLPLQPAGTLTAADLLGALLQNNHASKLGALYELSGTGWSPSLIERAGQPPIGTPFPLTVGAAYLLYSDQKNSYTEQGTVPATGPTWQLTRGWNLVGLSAASAALPAATVLAGVLASGSGGQLAAIYGLSGTSWSPSLIERAGQPPIGTPFTLAAGGQGYLLYTDHTATVSPGAPPAPGVPGLVRRALARRLSAPGAPTGGAAFLALPPLPG